MRYLLDTNVLLWSAVADRDRPLPARAEALIADPRNEVLFSSASIWEIVIKNSLGRSDFRVDPGTLVRWARDGGYDELPVTTEHTLAVADLPDLHRDPFDRVLIAQATVAGATLITSDRTIARYDGVDVLLLERPSSRRAHDPAH